MKIYVNGQFHDDASAMISVFDHGLLYGDGVFEGIRVYHGRVFRLKEHLRRLYMSARAILLDIGMTEQEMEQAVQDSVSANQTENGYIRLVVTRGRGTLGIDPRGCERPTVIIIVAPIAVYPPQSYEQGISIVTASTRRMQPDMLEPRVKSLNYLNNILARIEASRAGALEAVMLNSDGYVAECTVDNIFIVSRGVLKTPPVYMGALDGITMRVVLELAEAEAIPHRVEPLTRYDLYTADECFLTGTGAEMIPVREIDGRMLCQGSARESFTLTWRLMEAFRAMLLDPDRV